MNNDLYAEIAARLRRTREAFVPSLSEMEQAIGVPAKRWEQFERGTSAPHLPDLVAFCDRFDVSLDWLCRGRAEGLPDGLRERLSRG